MAECGMLLLIHGEVTTPDIDVFDREAEFIETILKPILHSHPTLKIVMEHITTLEAVDFITPGSFQSSRDYYRSSFTLQSIGYL